MSLYLVEVSTGSVERIEVDALLVRVGDVVVDAGGVVVESRVTADLKRSFTVVEHDGGDAAAVLAERLRDAQVEAEDVAAVRLVGAELAEVKAASVDGPRYLVEWDLPSDLTMETYLARKREKSPLYDQVPEVAFRRTYVREDMDKCLCFYDAPCADDVYRAREVVSAPVDRFHELT